MKTNKNSIAAFTPREIVSELDRYIIGQKDAKRAVSVALRNRWRPTTIGKPNEGGGVAKEHPYDWANRCW